MEFVIVLLILKGGCFFTPVSCDDNNACTVDSCDPATGCVHKNRTDCDDKDPCTIDTCVPATGCKYTRKTCSTGNLCNVSSCVAATGVCTTTQNICDDKNACTYDVGGGVFLPIDCTGGNKCILNECDKVLGCLNKTVNCSDGNACTRDFCDPVDGSCKNELIVCDDGDACTENQCNDTTGCFYTPFNVSQKCDDANICTEDTCNTTTGCVHTKIVCKTNYNSSCITAVCDPINFCQDVPVICNYTGSGISSCFVSYCEPNSGVCVSDELESCKLAAIVGGTAAAVLTVGAIIGIIIAAIVCAAGSAVGAYAGYNYVFKGEFTNKNPLFQADTQTGTSQIYQDNKK